MPLHLAEFTCTLASEAETLALGQAIAGGLCKGMVVYLIGDLGAGKTTLARGILQGLGFKGRVKSPTFSLVEVYEVSRLYLYHFDFYRFIASEDLKNSQAFRETGFTEHFDGQSVCLVEWPEKVAGLPPADLTVVLNVELVATAVELSAPEQVGRTARIFADSEAGLTCLTCLKTRNIRDPRAPHSIP